MLTRLQARAAYRGHLQRRITSPKLQQFSTSSSSRSLPSWKTTVSKGSGRKTQVDTLTNELDMYNDAMLISARRSRHRIASQDHRDHDSSAPRKQVNVCCRSKKGKVYRKKISSFLIWNLVQRITRYSFILTLAFITRFDTNLKKCFAILVQLIENKLRVPCGNRNEFRRKSSNLNNKSSDAAVVEPH